MSKATLPVRAITENLESYYRVHASIYDATRWSFLFGRKRILHQIAAIRSPANVLEVGCGTGYNLRTLAKIFPNAYLTGVDISPDMLAIARRNLYDMSDKIRLRRYEYNRPLQSVQKFDLILFSYALTMFNPGWQQAIAAAQEDLADGGIIALVDFHDSVWPLFKRWMAMNHVRMDGHLLPQVRSLFRPQVESVRRAYGGLWSYLMFIGEKDEGTDQQHATR